MKALATVTAEPAVIGIASGHRVNRSCKSGGNHNHWMKAGVPLSQCVHDGNVYLVWQKCPGELLYDDELWIAGTEVKNEPIHGCHS